MEKTVKKLFISLVFLTVSCEIKTIPFGWNTWKNKAAEMSRKTANLLFNSGKKCFIFVTKDSEIATIGRVLLLSGAYYIMPLVDNALLQVVVPLFIIEKIVSDKDSYFLNAVKNGDAERVKIAIDWGADVNKMWNFICWWNVAYSTPLIGAANEGHLEVVKTLVACNADINKAISQKRKDCKARQGQTALMVAAQVGHVPVVEFFLANGADITIKSDDDKIALQHAFEAEESIANKMGLAEILEEENKKWQEKKKNNAVIIELLSNAHYKKNTEILKTILSEITKFKDDLNAIPQLIAAYALPIVLTEEN